MSLTVAAISATASSFVGAKAWPANVKLSSAPANIGIECSSRPQKKATAHHMKTRPKKTAPWELRRKPTVYAPLPPLPPDWMAFQPDASADQPLAASSDE